MHTRFDDTTTHLKLTVELRTTLEGHSQLSRYPDVWDTLVSRLREDAERALRDAEAEVNYHKALDGSGQ
jgi:HEPN domain-containing protein